MTAKPIDNRASLRIMRAIRYGLPEPAIRPLVTLFYRAIKLLPYGLKYSIAGAFRRNKHPYRLLGDGDTVVQIGAPRDLLHAGRSRSIHFARLVGRGKVVVVEPEAESCTEMRCFVARHGLSDTIELVELGAWKEATTLSFLSSPVLPASNLVLGCQAISEEESRARHYRETRIEADTLDNILGRLPVGAPKLVSITTNGTELEVLEGMHGLIADGLPYVCLAGTNPKYPIALAKLGYRLLALDDRGFTFAKTETPTERATTGATA